MKGEYGELILKCDQPYPGYCLDNSSLYFIEGLLFFLFIGTIFIFLIWYEHELPENKELRELKRNKEKLKNFYEQQSKKRV